MAARANIMDEIVDSVRAVGSNSVTMIVSAQDANEDMPLSKKFSALQKELI